MKSNSVSSRARRYGGVSAVLTAAIIAVIILVNVIFSALATRFLWYVDLTPELLYSLSDECLSLIENGDENFPNSDSPLEKVDQMRADNRAHNEQNGLSKGDEGYRDEELMISIIFCDAPDVLASNASQRYVYHTALELEEKFPDHIDVKNYDVIHNPSAVDKYLTTAESTIATTSVVIECGSEFRVYGIRSFFTFEEDRPWAYSGEKKFAAGIMAVTRAESPLACFTVNHGEENSLTPALLNTLLDAGFEVDKIDLSTEEIPENCRLLVVFNPVSDFEVKKGDIKVDEIQKLDDFLDGTNSLMVFMSPTSPVHENLEEYLAEWGIAFERQTDASGTFPHRVKDPSNALSTDGYTFVSEYADYGAGKELTAEMQNSAYPRKVIFKDAMPIRFTYELAAYQNENEEDAVAEFFYGSYDKNGVSREIHDVFLATEGAVAEANGREVGRSTEQNPLKLMTLTKESRLTQESNYSALEEASYVLACGSVAFADETFLESSSYGNADLLLSACRAVGQEPVPVGLTFKPFADYEIDNITTSEMTQYAVVLTVLPAVIAMGAGIFVLVRRKNK